SDLTAGRWCRAPRGTRGCPRAGASTMACVRAVTTARHCSPFPRCCAAPAAAKRFPSRGTNRTCANRLRRVAPGTRPVGERGVPLQQMIDVRAEAELAEEERGEGHDDQPLEDVGRRPPPLE